MPSSLPFIAVGENIHCTRIYKVDGKYCKASGAGSYTIHYRSEQGPAELPIPQRFLENADWEAGRVKHCAVAIWQGYYGEGDAKAAGMDYLRSQARRQEASAASYLDINVDEFSTDVEERAALMQWTVDVVQSVATIPVSIDSSNLAILEAGLQAADRDKGRPMVNSVSLERADAIELAADHHAVVIASAAGETGLPNEVDERMANFGRLIPRLETAGFALSDIHADPLVFPISTDGQNGQRFLDTIKAIREAYGSEIHVVAGLSNISFGMPNRKLINQVFAHLCVEAGADGGIVDPLQINGRILEELDTRGNSYALARDLLLGKDDFGMNFIMAVRGGEL